MTVTVEEFFVRLAHPGLGSGADVRPPVVVELVGGQRTESRKAVRESAGPLPGRVAEPDGFLTAGCGSRTGRGPSRRRQRADRVVGSG